MSLHYLLNTEIKIDLSCSKIEHNQLFLRQLNGRNNILKYILADNVFTLKIPFLSGVI